eukprot:3981218-Pyramimonas_sp.AAC.1
MARDNQARLRLQLRPSPPVRANRAHGHRDDLILRNAPLLLLGDQLDRVVGDPLPPLGGIGLVELSLLVL